MTTHVLTNPTLKEKIDFSASAIKKELESHVKHLACVREVFSDALNKKENSEIDPEALAYLLTAQIYELESSIRMTMGHADDLLMA
ncbi:hypothetical protein JCM14469_26780 [Desulfatiferula olefinivorans]